MNEWDEATALDDPDGDAHHCELCGTPVEIVANPEGTTSYRPLGSAPGAGTWTATRELLRVIASLTSAVENHRCPTCRTPHIDPDLLGAIHQLAAVGQRWADALPSPSSPNGNRGGHP